MGKKENITARNARKGSKFKGPKLPSQKYTVPIILMVVYFA